MSSFLKYLLYPFTILYGSVVWLRNRLYDSGFMSAVSFDLPVIAVGNLSVGGTGKTPHVEYLVRLLQYEYRVATMSRGYKRRTRGFLLANEQSNALQIGDEPMQYHLKFPELVVSVAEERMTGIPSLLQHRPDVDLVILDDAYQHRSVKAGLNILITDYSRPFYKDHILPYGALRESRSAASRADVIIVSKCPATLSVQQAEEMKQRINALPHQQVFFSTIKYAPAYDFFSQQPVDLKTQKVLLVSGIARPEPLLAHVQQLAADVHLLSYPDHHFFTRRNLEEMRSARENWGNDAVIVTTEKDATRLHLYRKQLEEWQIPLIVLPITVDILLGAKESFDHMIRAYVRSAGPEQEYEVPVIE